LGDVLPRVGAPALDVAQLGGRFFGDHIAAANINDADIAVDYQSVAPRTREFDGNYAWSDDSFFALYHSSNCRK
jgi:hypothetical protein